MEKIVDQADCVNDTCDTQFNIMIDLNVPSPAIPSRRDARCMGYHSKFVERTGLCYRYELNLDQVHLGVRTIHTTCNRIHSFYAGFSLSANTIHNGTATNTAHNNRVHTNDGTHLSAKLLSSSQLNEKWGW